MVKKIIWTQKAKKELIEILEYLNNRNKSTRFSVKLNKLVEEQINLISEFPNIARATDISNVNVKVIHKYLLYYEVVDDVLYILTFRHGSKNPDTLKIR